MIQLRKTERFTQWLDGLRDAVGRARIQARIARLAAGNAGDVKPIGKGVSELRIDVGPGYRVYYMQRAKNSFCFWQAATNRRSKKILIWR